MRIRRLHLHWLVVIIGIFGLGLLPIGQDIHPQIRPLLMDALHVPAGFLVAFAIYRTSPANSNFRWLYALGLSSLLFGALEIVQPLMHRTASLSDVGRSMMGVGVGVLAAVLGYRKVRLGIIATLLLLPTASLYVATPALRASLSWLEADRQFPLLGHFERQTFRFVWRPIRDETLIILDHPPFYRETHPNDRRFLKVKTLHSEWSGVILQPTKTDWKEFSSLCFDARADRSDSRLLVLFDPALESMPPTSANTLSLSPEWSSLCVPIPVQQASATNTAPSVRRVVFALLNPDAAQFFALDNVRLAP